MQYSLPERDEDGEYTGTDFMEIFKIFPTKDALFFGTLSFDRV